MPVPTFALEVWMHEHETRPLRANLSGSTGPLWRLADLLALEELTPADLADSELAYAPITGSEELRAAIAERCGDDPEHVQVCTGAAEALAMLVAAGATPGGNVVYPVPGFPPFWTLPEVFHQEPRAYELRRADGFRLDPGRVIELIDERTGLVIINSPHNPTGALAGAAEMRAVQAACERHGARLAIDQVQHPIEHTRRSPAGSEIEGAITVGDMSKALSLPGLRIGWLIDPDAARHATYFDLRGFFTISSVPLTERLAAIALRQADRVLARARAVGGDNLARLRAFMTDHAEHLAWVEPEGGLIAFPWLRDEPSARPLCLALADAGVLLSPGDCFGSPEHVRLGFGSTDQPVFAESLAIIAATLRERLVGA